MKKIILPLFLMVVISTSLSAQVRKNAFVIESSFNYSHLVTGEGSAPEYEPESQIIFIDPEIEFNFPLVDDVYRGEESNMLGSFGVGYSLSDKDIIGVSFGINRQRNLIAFDYFNIDTITDSRTLTRTTFREETIHSYLYGLNYRRLIALGDRFFVAPRVAVFYEREVIRSRSATYNRLTGDVVTDFANNIKILNAFWTVELSASFLYQINNWLGVQAKVFKSRLRTNYKDTRFAFDPRLLDKRKLEIDANPINWEIGVFMVLGGQNKAD